MTKTSDIERVLRDGRRLRTRFLDIRVLTSPPGHARVGVVVPRFAFTAVRRNRLKRRLRELVRSQVLSVVDAHDVVIRARREAYDAAFRELGDDIARAVPQLASPT